MGTMPDLGLVCGVDSHADTIMAAVCDPTGRLLGTGAATGQPTCPPDHRPGQDEQPPCHRSNVHAAPPRARQTRIIRCLKRYIAREVHHTHQRPNHLTRRTETDAIWRGSEWVISGR